MTRSEANAAIRSLINLQNDIFTTGGTHALSTQNRNLIIKRNLVLKMFHLPATSVNITFLSQYPMSQAFDILKINDEYIYKVKHLGEWLSDFAIQTEYRDL